MSFSFYSFDAEAVNDVERYAVGVQSIFNNQHPIANVWLIAALPADLLWCFSRSMPLLGQEHHFPALDKSTHWAISLLSAYPIPCGTLKGYQSPEYIDYFSCCLSSSILRIAALSRLHCPSAV